MLLIAVLIQPLTQQPRYYLLTTVRQPLRSISWFVLAARSRLACGPPRLPTPELPLSGGPSQQAPHQHRHRPLGRLLAAPSPAHTVRLSCLAGASPLTQLPLMPCFYFPRRLAHVPCSS